MLPSHTSGPYGAFAGSSRRRGSAGPSPVVVYAVLITILCLLGFGYIKSSRLNHTYMTQLQQKQAEIQSLEDQLSHKRSSYSHIEYQYHSAQRRVSDTAIELGQVRTQLAECTATQEEAQQREAQLQDELKEQQEKVAYEKAVVEAHKYKVEQLEKAHNQREADWHSLSQKWAKFEEDAVKENLRLLGELNKCQANTAGAAAAAVSPPPAAEQKLPDPEPKTRPETEFDIKVQLPKEEEYVHPHPQRPPIQHRQPVPGGGPRPDPTPTASVPTQAQPSPAGQQPVQAPARELKQPDQAASPQPAPVPDAHNADGAHAHGNWGSDRGHVEAHHDAAHPAPEHHEHDSVYENHHYGWDHDHVDPLDHYWMDDHFDERHDGFHGENWHDPHAHDHHPDAAHDTHHDQHGQHDQHQGGDHGHDAHGQFHDSHDYHDWADAQHSQHAQHAQHGHHEEAVQQGPGGNVQVPISRGHGGAARAGRPDPKLIPRHDHNRHY